MNACMEAIYLNAKTQGIEVYAGVGGFDGIIDANFVKMTEANATGISNQSGCVFKCGRSKRIMESAGFKSAVANMKKNGFDALVVLGGNGSAIGTGRFKSAGVNTVFVPSTIDNDVEYTRHSLGFSSACESAVKNIDELKATMRTNNRDFIVHIMGRSCNELALRVGTATFADIIDMNGNRHTPDQVAQIFAQNRKNGKQSNFMVMQELQGGDQMFELERSFELLKQIRHASGGQIIQLCPLGYLQRGAQPSCYDRFLGAIYGEAVVDCIQKSQYGVCISAVNDKIVLVEIPVAPIPS